jgi:O-acetyl-ADP-ribose deacetylase (regulator of RNase III)
MECWVNPTNCEGIMGKGLALKFKEAFPSNYSAYYAAYIDKKLEVGKVLLHKLKPMPTKPKLLPTDPKWIINFPTKDHWRDGSKLEYITAGLWDMRAQLIKNKISSVAIPALGCGLGGLNWLNVRDEIDLILEDAGLVVEVYEPQ